MISDLRVNLLFTKINYSFQVTASHDNNKENIYESPWQRRSPDYSHSSNIPDSSLYTSEPQSQSSYLSSSQSETPYPNLSQSDSNYSADAHTIDQSQTRDSVNSQSVERYPVDPNIQISVIDDSIYEPIEYFDENEELSLDSDTDFHVDAARFGAGPDTSARSLQAHRGDYLDDKSDPVQSQPLFEDSQSETSEQSRDSRNTVV